MNKRNSSDIDSGYEPTEAAFMPERGRSAPRQRSARNDPAMRDGDSSHGNPYESDGPGDENTSDNDIGDTDNAAAEEADSGLGIDGLEIFDDAADNIDGRFPGTSRTGEVPPTTGDDEGEGPDEAVAAAEFVDRGEPAAEQRLRESRLARKQGANTPPASERKAAGKAGKSSKGTSKSVRKKKSGGTK